MLKKDVQAHCLSLLLCNHIVCVCGEEYLIMSCMHMYITDCFQHLLAVLYCSSNAEHVYSVSMYVAPGIHHVNQ